MPHPILVLVWSIVAVARGGVLGGERPGSCGAGAGVPAVARSRR
ncbi:MAG: hypothetical protein ACMG6S_14430 [Byssovorax sp.]